MRQMLAVVVALVLVAAVAQACGPASTNTSSTTAQVTTSGPTVAPASTVAPGSTAMPVSSTAPVSSGSAAASRPQMRVTILYDNTAVAPGTHAGWGFACLVEGFEQTVLFDTGADGDMLLQNMRTLAVDPLRIDAVVLSHQHSDHTGGLAALRVVNPGLTVYRQEAATVCRGVVVTAPLGDAGESGLLLDAGGRPVLLTGCAHAGVVRMVEAASAEAGRPVWAVLGGFHLSTASAAEVARIVDDLRALGVQRCGPAHCTGEAATARMREVFGEGFIPTGVGAVVTF